MNKNTFKWFRLVGVPSLGVLFYFCMIYISYWVDSDAYTLSYDWKEELESVLMCILFISLLSEGSILISRGLDWKLGWDTYPGYRFTVQVFLQTTYCLLTFLALLFLYEPTVGEVALRPQEIRQVMIMSTATTLLTSAIYTGMLFLQRWKNQLVESERLQRETVQAQFDALKHQIDPHFLFNTLTSLTTVIAEDQKMAIQYVEYMALVYRYILQMKDQKAIDLAAELEFAQAYVFLLQMRFGTNLQVCFRVPEEYYSRKIAPMALQLLLENATKHNAISRDAILQVRVTVEADNWLVVSNNLRPKLVHETSTGLGIQHLRSRYALLTETAPEVTRSASAFAVKLPLLTQSDFDHDKRAPD